MSSLKIKHEEVKLKFSAKLILLAVEDFYLCFMEDAELLSEVLEYPLERKVVDGDEMYMSGFPDYMLDTNLPILVNRLGRVALISDTDKITQEINRDIYGR